MRRSVILAGVMLAKTEAAEHVTETFDRLGGSTPVLALVESALGIEEAVSIARARSSTSQWSLPVWRVKLEGTRIASAPIWRSATYCSAKRMS